MCGLLLHYAKVDSAAISSEQFENMLVQLAHRGPDDQRIYRRGKITLGHRRLSIIDVEQGVQPIFNEDKTVACVANGEIYNFDELRKGLLEEGHRFRSKTDSEVIVHLYENFGTGLFQRLTGMFGFALADFKSDTVLVGRDRLGEKPIYYIDTPEMFACASELRALLALPGLSARMDPVALARYLRFGWIAGACSIVEGVRRLEPGHYLTLKGRDLQKHRYWKPDLTPLESMSREAILEQLPHVLDEAIRNKLVSDVPLGVLLSGGLDSSTVVAFASRHTPSRLKTFAVGFGSSLNELPYARAVAEAYNTDHTEVVIDTNLAESVFDVARHFDEPFADSSAVPTYIICREAREHVTVMLTGDGGDELLAGYSGYLPLRGYSDVRVLRGLAKYLDRASNGLLGSPLLDHLYPLPFVSDASAVWEDLRSKFSWSEIESLMRIGNRHTAGLPDAKLELAQDDPLNQAFTFDVNWYLPDDLLKKVDMASMASGLECRAPLLDHHFVEFCMRIPAAQKVWGNETKSLLRDAMQKRLPQEIIHREKHGFGAPLTEWLTKDLHPLVESLKSSSAKIGTVLDSRFVGELVTESMQAIRSDWRAPARVWSLLMLELWLQEYPIASPYRG